LAPGGFSVAQSLHVLARGTGRDLITSAGRLAQLESRQPKGTRMELRANWQVLHLFGVGTVHTGDIAAQAINSAYRSGRLVSGGHGLQTWGGSLPAAYDPGTRTLQVRWVARSAFLPVVVTALSGVTAGFIASALGLPGGTAALIGLGVALAVGAAFVATYATAFLFGTVPSPGQPVHVPLLPVLLVGMGALAFFIVLPPKAPQRGSGP
jgi:hypothetical protein